MRVRPKVCAHRASKSRPFPLPPLYIHAQRTKMLARTTNSAPTQPLLAWQRGVWLGQQRRTGHGRSSHSRTRSRALVSSVLVAFAYGCSQPGTKQTTKLRPLPCLPDLRSFSERLRRVFDHRFTDLQHPRLLHSILVCALCVSLCVFTKKRSVASNHARIKVKFNPRSRLIDRGQRRQILPCVRRPLGGVELLTPVCCFGFRVIECSRSPGFTYPVGD